MISLAGLRSDNLSRFDHPQSSDSEYKTLFENAMEGIFKTSPDGVLITVNPALARILGYESPQELLEKIRGREELAYVNPNRRKRFLKIIHRKGEISNFESQMMRKDGSIIWVSESARAVFDEAGRMVYYEGFIQDVTDRKLAEEERAQLLIEQAARAEAEAAQKELEVEIKKRVKLEKQKDEFLAIASHELKTPVTTIKAYAQLLQEQFGKKGQSAPNIFLEKINLQINNLTKLIHELLDVTRIEEGKLLFKRSKLNLKDLILQVVEDLRPTIPSHKLIVKKLPDAQTFVDRDRIGQVLINLISNAVKYSPGRDSVIIKSNKDENFVTISVKDFGIGIPGKHQKQIFDRFFRSMDGEQDTFSGLGLGLYIASRIVDNHGGKIRVKSKVGKGSTFYFKIPVIKE